MVGLIRGEGDRDRSGLRMDSSLNLRVRYGLCEGCGFKDLVILVLEARR